jgi:hypothetical protein
MKITLVSFMVCTIATVNAATERIMSAASYTDKTFDSLEVMGTLTGSKLKASSIKVYGPTNLKESVIGTARILGPLTAQDTLFNGPVEAHGTIQAVDSIFKDTLSTDGEEIELSLENSSAESISITRMKSGIQKKTNNGSVSYVSGIKKKEADGMGVILKGKKTHVAGPIEFIGETGTVTLEDDATFTGEVINGKIEKRKIEISSNTDTLNDEGRAI